MWCSQQLLYSGRSGAPRLSRVNLCQIKYANEFNFVSVGFKALWYNESSSDGLQRRIVQILMHMLYDGCFLPSMKNLYPRFQLHIF